MVIFPFKHPPARAEKLAAMDVIKAEHLKRLREREVRCRVKWRQLGEGESRLWGWDLPSGKHT